MRLSSDELDDAYRQYLNEVEDDVRTTELSAGPDETPPKVMATDSE